MKEPTPGKPVPLESPPQERLHRRLGKRLVVGGLIGAVLGIGVGALVGAIWFERAGAALTSALAGGIFGIAVAMLMSGYSSLESPDPGSEPSDTARPVADRPGAVREEYDEGSSS